MNVPQIIEVEWSTNFLSSGWRCVDGSATFLFWKYRLNRVPRSCLDEHALARLKAAVGHEFIVWWLNEALGSDATCFGLRFPTAGWAIPWETLVGTLKPESAHRASFIRRLEATQTASPSSFEEPLRILIVQGAANDPSDPTVATLALDRERDGLLLAWGLLEESVRSGVETPKVCQQPLDGIRDEARTWQPHVVVFSGHGRARGGRSADTDVLMADGRWIAGKDFAAALGAGGRYPVFVMLWACNTGRDAAPRHGTWAPGLAQRLIESGCVAVLAMQDAISDASAILLGRECLTLLARGVPLDRSVALVRAQLLTQRPEYSHPQDWASPTIWSASSIVAGVKWASPASDLAERQLAAVRLLRGTFEAAGGLIEAASADEELKADGWLRAGRTWVMGESTVAEHAHRWVRILRIIQVRQPVVVLAIELTSVNLEIALREWAERVKAYTYPGELPQPFGEKIRELERNTREVWAELCAMPGCFLAIALPHSPAEPAPWFWGPLLEPASEARWAILSTSGPDAHDTSWDIDNLEPVHMDSEDIRVATHRAGRLVHALAALNVPLPSAYVQVEPHEGPQNLKEWADAQNFTLETGYGRVLRGSVRQSVLRSSSPTELALGARDAVAILSDERVLKSLDVRERRLDLLLAAELFDEGLVEAADLAVLRRQQDQPRLTLSLLRRLDRADPALKFNLPTLGKLMIASAHLSLGEVDDARFWLERAEPQDVIEEALRHALLAEVEKSSPEVGGRNRAQAQIDTAIAVCQRELERGDHSPELTAAYRSYRQDRARILQYLFYDRAAALSLYEGLIAEWRDVPDAVMDLAVVTRNYAECLRVVSANAPVDLGTASTLLRRSIESLRGRASAPALAELHYELAKTLSAQGAYDGERAELVAGQAAAVASGYDMMLALVRNRMFWRFGHFSLAQWQAQAKALEQFAGHGWAARALLNGRIAAARLLLGSENTTGAVAELESARAELDRFRSLDQGSDRWRRAAVAAGLDLAHDGRVPGRAWSAFLGSAPWAAEWLAAEGLTPDRVWEAWHERSRR